MLGVIAGADADDPTASPRAVSDYPAASAGGVKGKRIGVPKGLRDLDDHSRHALDGAIEALSKAGAEMLDVTLPADFEQGARDWLPLCAVECAVVHAATYPSRASEYGAVLATLIETGRKLSGLEVARLQLNRAGLSGELEKLLASVDLLLMPVMGRAVWSLDALAGAGRDPEMVAARLRYTAPFDLSGQPSLTLAGWHDRRWRAHRLSDRRALVRRGRYPGCRARLPAANRLASQAAAALTQATIHGP